MLRSAVEHYQRQQRITAAALVRTRKARSAVEVAQIVAAFQLLAARDAVASVPNMLAEQGIPDEPVATVATASLAGVASDGRTLEGLFAQASSPFALSMMVATQVQDAARGAASVATAVRPNVTGYVRMLNPPSCSRCAILAGKFYKWNDGFQRHPKCDCRHIPSTEDRAGDLTTNPDAYFHSLPGAADLEKRYPDLTIAARREAGVYSQEDIFTKAGAQAIRDGGDISQIVNARRGMSTAAIDVTGRPVGRIARVDVYGRPAFITREGITSRGVAGRNLGNLEKQAGRKYRASKTPRLMPESIYEVAKDRDDAIRLLRRFGFIL